MTDYLHVRVQQEVKKRFEEEAAKRSKSTSDLLRELIERFLEGPDNPRAITSDGRYKIEDGQLYELQSFRPGGPGVWCKIDPAAIKERAAGQSWRRQLAEQELAMKKEAHAADMTLKRIQIFKAQKRYAPETIPQRCKVPGCPVGDVVFKDLAALNQHLREYHPDRIVDVHDRGVSLENATAGDFWGRQGAIEPRLRWYGQK